MPTQSDTTELALAPALRGRLLGVGLVTVGAVVLLVVVATALLGLPGAVLAGVLLLALVGVIVLGLLVGVRRWVVRLDPDGYRVRGIRSAGALSARWTDVLDLQTATVAGSRCAVLRLRDGRTTNLPVDVLEGDPQALVDLLSDRLDRGHGYRRLRRPSG